MPTAPPLGVIFDMDGVLCDSESLICEAACRMFDEVHRVAVKPEDFLPFVGTGEDRYIGGVAEKYQITARDPAAEKAATYRIYLDIIKGRLRPLAGVVEFVRLLREREVRTAVGSSADLVKVQGNLAEIGLPPETHFDAVVSGNDVTHKKPAPDLFHLAAARLGLRPGECVVVEDAPSGVKAGKAAGSRVLGITSSFDEKTLRDAGADWIAPDLRTAASILAISPSPGTPGEGKELAQLTAISHELGVESRQLTILGEGNTSADLGDGTFLVKGSGSRMATIKPEQFTRVRTADVLAMIERPDLSEQAIEDGLRAAQVDPKASKPSIETLLHAICLTAGRAKFVGHSHAEAVMHLLCGRHGATPFLRHIFPDAVVVCGRVPMVVPYADPGMPLAVAFRRSLDGYLQEHAAPPKLVLMLNHGIVALGQSATEVLNITLMAQKWARVLAGAMAVGEPTFLPAESVQKLDSRLDEQYRRRQLGQ